MIFDTPQWSIKADPSNKHQVYCNIVDNRLSVMDGSKDLGDIIIAVPSGIFPFLQYMNIKPENGLVELFIEGHKGTWYFGFDQGIGTPEYILWTYSQKQLPKCVSHRLTRN